jgi:hypothetical protein
MGGGKGRGGEGREYWGQKGITDRMVGRREGGREERRKRREGEREGKWDKLGPPLNVWGKFTPMWLTEGSTFKPVTLSAAGRSLQ